MINAMGTRKRCISKKSLKSGESGAVDNFTNQPHSTEGKQQASLLEVVVRCDKEVSEQLTERKETQNDTDMKPRSSRVSHYNETISGDDRFVSELICNPKGGRQTWQSNSVVINLCGNDDGPVQVFEDISNPERSEKRATQSCKIGNECSNHRPAQQKCNFQSKEVKCDELGTTQTHRKTTDQNGKVCETALVLKHSKDATESEGMFEIPISAPQHNKNTTEEGDASPTNIGNEKTHGDEILTLKGEYTHLEKAVRDELFPKEYSLKLNDTCNIYSDSENTASKKGVVSEFHYCTFSVDNNGARVSSKGDDQSGEDTKKTIPIITVDSMDYCDLEHETGRRKNPFPKSVQFAGHHSEKVTENKVPIITVDSMDYCDLDYATGLPNFDFKPVQLINSFPASSDCNVAQSKNKANNPRQGFKFSRSASHYDVSSLSINRNSEFSYSADIYYESLSGPEGIDVIKHGAEGMTESRRQSLEDVVPELPSRFLSSADRFGNPSGFVQNLFWWRRPSDITELRSRTKHPCEEENTECNVVCSDSSCRRHSDNVFCKPKKFLTLRFNQLREMWNKLDKHSSKVKPSRTPSLDSVSVVELHDYRDDPEFRHHQEEKNELIVNTLREVVRKCTFMDPLQRPTSNEVYKKLKKVLLY